MTVADVMTAFPEAVRPEDSIQKAAQAMRDGDYGAVPIVDDLGVLVGIITDRDIVVQAVASGRDLGTPVRSYMTPNPDVIPSDATTEQALTVMTSHQIRRMPVVENGRLIGMLSLADIATSNVPAAEKAEAVQSVSLGSGGNLTEPTQSLIRNA